MPKVIAHGADREDARRRLVAALENSTALGVPTNRAFLIEALRHPTFGPSAFSCVQRAIE